MRSLNSMCLHLETTAARVVLQLALGGGECVAHDRPDIPARAIFGLLAEIGRVTDGDFLAGHDEVDVDVEPAAADIVAMRFADENAAGDDTWPIGLEFFGAMPDITLEPVAFFEVAEGHFDMIHASPRQLLFLSIVT